MCCLQADVGDPQTVSNSLAPFLTLATVTTGTRGTSAAPQQRPAAAATTSVATDAAPAASTEADAASPAAAVAGTPSDTEEVVSAEDKA